MSFSLISNFLMSLLKFVILDVFATERFTGNQLAVFLNCGDLSTELMQKIAREINYSETTFIKSSELTDGGYDVRIFTPTTELPFAGHPTLGTAFAIQQEIIKEPIECIKLNYQVGQISVKINYLDSQPDILWMQQKSPEFFEPVKATDIAPVLGVETTDIDSRYPIVPVSTGLPFIIVPLTSLTAVSKAKLNLHLYNSLVANLPAQAILIFCPETVSRDRALHARVFTECFGIPEDPATGSGNGCLAAYLWRYRYFEREDVDIAVEQGVELGRASLLYLRAQSVGDNIDVRVGGRVVNIARGEFFT
jgi:trans-2,3-dihydro-3-hydroxyanthranilate isomerase